MQNTLAGKPLYITLDASRASWDEAKTAYLAYAQQYNKTHSFAVVCTEVNGARRVVLTSKAKRSAK